MRGADSSKLQMLTFVLHLTTTILMTGTKSVSAFSLHKHMRRTAPIGSKLGDAIQVHTATTDIQNETLSGSESLDGMDEIVTDTSLGLGAPVQNFNSVLECLDFLDGLSGTEDDTLVVVKYYASYCRICKRASITYKKIASQKEYEGDFSFARVEAGRLASDRLRTLGITKFPFIQIFRKGMCVASFSTGASHLFSRRVRDTLDLCQQRSADDWKAFENEFQVQISENQKSRKAVAESLRLASLPRP